MEIDESSLKVVEIKDLAKRYSKELDYAIKDININAYAGEIIGIVGVNGAGKSTVIKSLVGLHEYDEGSIAINSYDLKKYELEAKKSFGYVPDEFVFYDRMTGMEHLMFLADIYGIKTEDRKKRIEDLEKYIGLGKNIYKQINQYSHGMKQKLALFSALIHNPEVFILDEPFVGLDLITTRNLKKLFLDYAKTEGHTVLYSSHSIESIEKLCDRVYFILNGSVIEEIDMIEFAKKGVNLEDYFIETVNEVFNYE